MIDTHVHLNNKDLGSADALPGVLERAVEAGVNHFVVVGYDLASSERAIRLAENDDRIRATIGVHPHEAAHYDANTETKLRTWATHPRVVAIGEIGLDFYRDLSPRDAQYHAFRAQLTMAQETNLPVVIHCRDAYPETMELLEAEAGDTPIILHCFAGDADDARRAFSRNWYIGVGGTLTYKKNDALRDIVKRAPQKSILLETDAPYLSPEPLRGKYPNEPARVALVANRLSTLRGESHEEITRYTAENAHRVFSRL